MDKNDFSLIWLDTVRDILYNGVDVSPRGMLTKETPQRTIIVNMRKPVLCVPERKISYTFMAAEAYWILTGDDRVSTIEPFNKNIAKFSDNGETFYGAYGPKIKSQLGDLVQKLISDPDSRQAGLTIWRENPKPTKDVPCTVAIFFNIRDNKLNAYVFMRSSDVWLGVPYDVFNFSMLSNLVCCMLNKKRGVEDCVTPGTLYLTAASSHIYESNFAAANNLMLTTVKEQNDTPNFMWHDSYQLMKTLEDLRYSKTGDRIRWWEQ